MNPSLTQIFATSIFGFAVLHTFICNRFLSLAHQFKEGSVKRNIFQLLGEVEVVFGIWAAAFLIVMIFLDGPSAMVNYAESLDFTEPLFVFALMTVAATRPVIDLATRVLSVVSNLLPLSPQLSTYFISLSLGPLLGSLITEPAAMVVVALILKNRFFGEGASDRLKYATLALLFVNVSIGGALTHFAAPPVLMVANKWQWGFGFMISNFGWKVAIAVICNSAVGTYLLRRDLFSLKWSTVSERNLHLRMSFAHLAFLLLIVVASHHAVIFMGLFLLFLGFASVTDAYQDRLQIKESLLVAFFLGGVVVLGAEQSWWLGPLIQKLNPLPLFLGTTGLTAFTDNAALTYIGSRLEGVSDAFKFALVAGALAGGGLTVIANAPNPAGYSILRERFGTDGIKPLRLFKYALLPTLVAMACLWLLG